MESVTVQKLTSLCTKLDELSSLSTGLLQAIEANDEDMVLACIRESRQARAALTRTQREIDALQLDKSPEELELLAKATELMAMVTVGDQVTEKWLGRSLPPDEVMLESEAGQIFLADAMLPAVWDYEADVAVLVGPGLSAVAKHLVAFGQKRIYVFLPEETDETYHPEVVRLASLDEIEPCILNMPKPSPQRIATRQLPNSGLSEKMQNKVVVRMHEALSDARVHRNTIVNFAKTWVTQGIANLVPIAKSPSIETIGDAFAGKPMIIVAPGPSLKKNIHHLKKAKGKALIMAFSHSVAPLSKEGIDPDFVMSVDPQDVRYHFSETDMSKVAAVINGATVHPDLFRLGAPRTITLAANSDLEQWIFGAFDEQARASGGGSVATTALSVALAWKCNPIVFCGLDLSFPEGKLYIDTSLDGEAEMIADGEGNVRSVGWSEHCEDMQKRCNPHGTRVVRGVELPGYYGDKVSSDFMFSMFHRWFEHTARGVGDAVRLVNCTEGGAYIDGMEHRPLADTVGEFNSPVDPGAIIDSVIGSMGIGARQKKMTNWLLGLLKELDTCLSLAHRCKLLAKKAHNRDGHERLQEFEKRLMEAVAPLRFVSMLAQPEIERALEDARHAESVTEALRSSQHIFDSVVENANWIRPQLREAVERVVGELPEE